MITAHKTIVEAKVKAKNKAELLEKLANEINQMPDFVEARLSFFSIITTRIETVESFVDEVV